MSDKDEIKELFQRELGNYEAKVDPGIWSGIQSGISTSAGVGTTMSVAAKVVIGVVSAAVVVVGSIFIYNSVSEDDEKKLSESNTENPIENIVKVKDDSTIDYEDNQNENVRKEVDNIKQEELTTQPEEKVDVNKDIGGEELSDDVPTEINSEQNSSAMHSDPQVKTYTEDPVVNSNSQSNHEENSSATDESKEVKVESNEVVPTLKIVPSILEQKNQYVKFECLTENVKEIVWDFGDGNLSTQLNPEHFYDQPGSYNVEVTGRNGEEEIYKNINVVVEIDGQITKTPNSFTPNGDRDNDYLFIESKGLKEFQITIMNNKQEVVYKSNDMNFKWDGNLSNGTPAPEGNYIYIIVAKDNQDNTLNNYQQLHLSR